MTNVAPPKKSKKTNETCILVSLGIAIVTDIIL